MPEVHQLTRMKLLIADSGNTKTDWAFLHDGKPIYLRGTGLHPAYSSDDEIREEIRKTAGHLTPSAIRFYGAGCYSDDVKARFEKIFRAIFGTEHLAINDDLLAAAHAIPGSNPGIVAILGTGSICGRYNGHRLTDRSAALGYAIGDEGSAADMGRRIIKEFLRNRFDDETAKRVSGSLNETSYAALMEKIYRSEIPARQLASIAGEVLNHPLTDQLSGIVSGAFRDFITGQLSMLKAKSDEPVYFTGTVALRHQTLLKDEMNKAGYHIVHIGERVIEGLVQYYNKP